MKIKLCTLLLLISAYIGLNAQAIKMNEIYSIGKSASHPDLDWIELYNSSSAQIDISGYKIYDSGGNSGTKPKMTLANGTFIPSKGFFVISTDIPTSTDPSGFGLSSSGEKVWLEDKTGAVIDTVTFSAMTETQTYSRIPDGGAWKLVSKMTKGASNGTGSSIETKNEIATAYMLKQNYPNPFNPTTKFEYSIPKAGIVSLKVYDILGNEVASLVNYFQNAGSYTADFDANNLTSGVYIYKIQSGNFVKSNKMVLIK